MADPPDQLFPMSACGSRTDKVEIESRLHAARNSTIATSPVLREAWSLIGTSTTSDGAALVAIGDGGAKYGWRVQDSIIGGLRRELRPSEAALVRAGGDASQRLPCQVLRSPRASCHEAAHMVVLHRTGRWGADTPDAIGGTGACAPSPGGTFRIGDQRATNHSVRLVH